MTDLSTKETPVFYEAVIVLLARAALCLVFKRASSL